MRAKQIATHALPEVKERTSASLREANARPEVKARRAAANARPEVKARKSAAQLIAQNRPEVKARIAATRARNRAQRLAACVGVDVLALAA